MSRNKPFLSNVGPVWGNFCWAHKTFKISLVSTIMALKVADPNSIKDALKSVLAPGQTRGWYEA